MSKPGMIGVFFSGRIITTFHCKFIHLNYFSKILMVPDYLRIWTDAPNERIPLARLNY
jgi:hypothetical protein